MNASKKPFWLFIFCFFFGLGKAVLPAQSIDNERFSSFSHAERLAFVHGFPFWQKDSAIIFRTIIEWLPIAEEKGDWSSAFALRHVRYSTKIPAAESINEVDAMASLAEKHGLEAEKIVARSYQNRNRFYGGQMPYEQMWVESLRLFADAERLGLEKLRPYRVDEILNGLANFFLDMGDIDRAERILRTAEPFLEPTPEKINTFTLAHNSLQFCRQQKGDLNSAIVLAKRIVEANEKIAANNPDHYGWRAHFWQGLSSLDVAKMLIETGDLAEGERWADRGWAKIRAPESFNEASSEGEFAALQVLISIKLKVGKTAEAEPLINLGRAIFEKLDPGQANYERVTGDFLKNQAFFYEKIGNWVAFGHFSKKASALADSIERRSDARKFEQLSQRVEAEQFEGKIRLVEREKAVQVMLRNALAVIFLLTMALGWSVFSKIRAKRRLAETELLAARKRLEEVTAGFHEKSGLLERMGTEIEKMAFSEEREKLQSELRAQVILTAEDWGRFRSLFERVHPGFIESETANFPSLTAGELRQSMLDKLGLSNREIGDLLGISEASVRQARWRLRKKTEA